MIDPVKIVTNVGGFSWMRLEEPKIKTIEILGESLNLINDSEVEIILRLWLLFHGILVGKDFKYFFGAK